MSEWGAGGGEVGGGRHARADSLPALLPLPPRLLAALLCLPSFALRRPLQFTLALLLMLLMALCR